MRDLESTNVEAAAHLAREADPVDDDRPSPSDLADDERYWGDLDDACAAAEDDPRRELDE